MDRPVPRPTRHASIAPPGHLDGTTGAGADLAARPARTSRFARTEASRPADASAASTSAAAYRATGLAPSPVLQGPAAYATFAHGAYVPTAAYLPGGGFDPGEAYGVDPPLTGFRGRIPRTDA